MPITSKIADYASTGGGTTVRKLRVFSIRLLTILATIGMATATMGVEAGQQGDLPSISHPPLLSPERMGRIHASIDADATTYKQLKREVGELVSRNNANAHEGVLQTVALQIAVDGGDVSRRVRNWFVSEYLREQSRDRGGFGNPENRNGYAGRNSARSYLARMGYAFAWVDFYAPDVFTPAERTEVLSNLAFWIEHWLDHWEDPGRRATFYPQDSDETLMLWESVLVYYYILGPEHELAERLWAASNGLRDLVEKAYITPGAGTFGDGAILVSPTYNAGDLGFLTRARLLTRELGGSLAMDPAWTQKAARFELAHMLPDFRGKPVYHDMPSASFDHNNDGWLKTGNMASYATVINYLFDTEGTPESRAMQWVLRRLPPLVQESNPEWRAGFIWGQLLMEDLVNYPPASPSELKIPSYHYAEGANVFAAKASWEDDANSFYSHNTKRFEIDHFGQYGLHYEIWADNRPVSKNGSGAVQGSKGHYANVQNTWYVENAESNKHHIGVQVPNMRVGGRESGTKTQIRRGTGYGATSNDQYAAVSWGARWLYNMRGNRWNPDVDYLDLASRSIINFWDGLTVVHDRVKQNTDALQDIKKPDGYIRRAHRKQRFEGRPEQVDGWLRAEEHGRWHLMRTYTLVGNDPVIEIVDENGPLFGSLRRNQFYPSQRRYHVNTQYSGSPDIEAITVHRWGDRRVSAPDVQEVQITSGDFSGLHIARDDRHDIVVFDRAPEQGDKKERVNISLPDGLDGEVVYLHVMGLETGSTYDVVRSGKLVSVSPGGSITVDSAKVLSIDLQGVEESASH